MPWPTVQINTWSDFTGLTERMTAKTLLPNIYVMRGQADESWPLKPSLLRYFTEGITAEVALETERAALEEFRSHAHLHLPMEILPERRGLALDVFWGEWWALMQHYHAPTRLLDWTFSPYVAAYFAVEQERTKNGAIYVVHHPTAMRSFLAVHEKPEIAQEEIIAKDSKPTLAFFSPKKKTDRLVAHQGTFSLCTNILGIHDDLVCADCGPAAQEHPGELFFEKWVIHSSLKLQFLRNLRMMNIAAHTLFPGIDGIGRSVAEMATLAMVLRQSAAQD